MGKIQMLHTTTTRSGSHHHQAVSALQVAHHKRITLVVEQRHLLDHSMPPEWPQPVT